MSLSAPLEGGKTEQPLRCPLGSVRKCLLADLIAIDGDPLADPGVFAQPDQIVLVLKATGW